MTPSSRFNFSLIPCLLSAVALLAFTGCDEGACVTHNANSNGKYYFCIDDSLSQCQDFWCDPEDTYCAQFSSYSCDEIGLGSSSESFSEPESPDWSMGTVDSSGSGGGGGGSCTSSYQGPMGDAQVYTQCASVWNYRCQAKNNDAADKNCLVYKSLQATVACPYCR
ncbi:MAG TPA: hypothetical protein VJV78_35345 [Polyangiales bacterium]|nr:hypothetical protein [Polyangiales bacterium]